MAREREARQGIGGASLRSNAVRYPAGADTKRGNNKVNDIRRGKRTKQNFAAFVPMAAFTPLATLPAMVGQRASNEEFELFCGRVIQRREADGSVAFIVKIIGKQRAEV